MSHIQNILDNFNLTNNQQFNLDIDEITENDPKADQPNSNIKLYSHQLSLLYKCIDYENNNQYLSNYNSLSLFKNILDYFKTNIGIIADKVGSGKSYVLLSLILVNNIINRNNVVVKSSALNNIAYYFNDIKNTIKTSVLVIPHNLCNQWEYYINTFNNKFKYAILNKQKILNIIENKNIESYDIIVVTSTFYNKLSNLLMKLNLKVQRLIFDEVDSLNIPGCLQIEANFTWFITSSYGNLLYPRGYTKYDINNNRYIWCAYGIRNSGFLKNLFLDISINMPQELNKIIILKNNDKYIDLSLNIPNIFYQIIKCKTPYTINILNGIVDINIINNLNAGDIEAAMSFISNKNKGTEDNIISLLINKYNRQILNLQLRYNLTNDFIYENENDKELERVNILKQINDLNHKIKLIEERITNNDICAICYDMIDNKTIIDCCQNSFCFKCIHIWLKNKPICPMCKETISNDKVFVVDSTSNNLEEENINEDEFNEKFDKLKNLEILLNKKKENAKILIFSSYDHSLNNMTSILDKLNINYDYIKGNGDQVNSIIKKYKSNTLDVLLVNSNNYGTGLNLENTTDIIMFHKMNTQLEKQIIGRAQRLGRIIPLNVYYLLHDNEIVN